MEAVFWSTEIVFFNSIFLASGNGFWLSANLFLLFKAFFCQWTPFLKLNVDLFFKKKQHYSCLLKPFSWIFQNILTSGSSIFRLVETEFSSKPSSRPVYTGFGLIVNRVLLFRAFFPAAGKHY